MTLDNYCCKKDGCTGDLEELPEHEQTTNDDYTEAWCADCNRHHVLLQCENCGSTSFDIVEVLEFRGWVDAQTHEHTKNSEEAYNAAHIDTQIMDCSECGTEISFTPPDNPPL